MHTRINVKDVGFGRVKVCLKHYNASWYTIVDDTEAEIEWAAKYLLSMIPRLV